MIIIAVDFDNTLALGNCELKNLKPNNELIKRLQETDAYIKIVTARGSKNKLSKTQKVNKYYKEIKNWLDNYNVPYNEISFNKEYAHLYIDDMAITEYSDWENIKSSFTKNNIILTEKTAIKKCKTALNEFEWYKIAAKNNIKIPNVRFCNDELIITDRLISHTKFNLSSAIELLLKFKEIKPINNASFETYLNNISEFEKIDLISHEPTFYHGDYSTQNIIFSNNELYLIDPNYKNVFGSYITDSGKLAFSLYAYENDINGMKEVWNKIPESIQFTIAEGYRVCKYKNLIDKVNEIKKLI